MGDTLNKKLMRCWEECEGRKDPAVGLPVSMEPATGEIGPGGKRTGSMRTRHGKIRGCI